MIQRFSAVALLAASAAAQVQPDAVLLRTPDVSADSIVFRYANDLWLVDKRGGAARPLSSPAGPESNPKFSPDGTRIAFTASYDGGQDIYVLDLVGGVPRRVTHHPTSELLCDWQPDGQALVFASTAQSGQARAPALFRVGADGGEPERLPIPYGTFGSVDETGSWLAYTPDAGEMRNWKRYQGGLAQDIWLFNLVTFESRRITEHPGADVLPMWNGASVYYVSDAGAKARANLWVYDVQKKSAEVVTEFADSDVRAASVGPLDIVFESGGKLWRCELATRLTAPVTVVIPGDRPKLVPHTLDVAKDLLGASVGPSGARVVFEARGELFDVPAGEGVTRNLTNSDGIAERYPAWSPDGKSVAYFSDRSGEYELCVRAVDGSEPERQLTKLGRGWRLGLWWSPDSRSLAYVTRKGELWLVSALDGVPRLVATSPEGNSPTPAWSADSRWIAFAMRASKSRASAVYVHDRDSGDTRQVTSGQFDEGDPAFDRNGDWLYLTSQREFRDLDSDLDDNFIFSGTRALCAIALRRDVVNPLAPVDPREGKGARAASESADEDEPKVESEKPSPKPVAIEFEGIEGRLVRWPVKPGAIASLSAQAGAVLYVRSPFGGAEGEPRLVRFEPGAKKSEREEQLVLDKVSAYELTADGAKVLAKVGERWHVVAAAADAKLGDALDLGGLVLTIDPRREWAQVLSDVRRQYSAAFYDEGMHGVDWEAVCARYLAAIADCSSRDDVHFLITELIGELNVGHAYNFGGEGVPERAAEGQRAGLLGADWTVEDGRFRLARVLGAGSSDPRARGPLAEPLLDARAGDWLLEVNGVAPDASRDLCAAFLGRIGRATEIVLCATPAKDGSERRLVVVPIESESELRYRDWVATRASRVDELSGGKVGYVHVPDTATDGRRELFSQLVSQYHKDALLVDERWNAGGQFPNRFVEALARPRTNFWASRAHEDWITPSFAHHGPKAMLINGAAGSGGDMFPYLFRQAKLGPLVGRRTWGGLVGITEEPSLVDGTRVSVPCFAFYELDGTWGVEGYGVAPDIEVMDDPALMVGGGDPQLEAAVSHLLKEIAVFEFHRPRRPAGPDRRGPGVSPEDR